MRKETEIIFFFSNKGPYNYIWQLTKLGWLNKIAICKCKQKSINKRVSVLFGFAICFRVLVIEDNSRIEQEIGFRLYPIDALIDYCFQVSNIVQCVSINYKS